MHKNTENNLSKLLLLSLSVLLLLVALPHFRNLGSWIMVFFCITILIRLAALRFPVLSQSRLLIGSLLIAAVALVLLTADINDGRRAGTSLLVAMLGLKLLELKTDRDLYISIFLGYFVVITQFLYRQDLWLALYLFVLSAFLTALLISVNRVTANIQAQTRYAVLMMFGAMPLALVLFFLFPRLDSPLWSITTHTNQAVTGLSDRMSPGNISQLSQSDALAFRIKFLDTVPAPEDRYWRGAVLWKTDGRNWSPAYGQEKPKSLKSNSSQLIHYEITTEPNNTPWLVALERPNKAPSGMHLNDDYQIILGKPLKTRKTLQMQASSGADIDWISQDQRELGLELPDFVSERTRLLAGSWLDQYGSDQPHKIIAAALDYFRQGEFRYSLTPGQLRGDPTDSFLFETRSGFCEHYAAAFTVLMRVTGIPTRVVLGYQGGVKNPLADHWIVRQSDAHAWTEVWIEGQGWKRIDPTAAVSPERIQRPIDPARSSSSTNVVFSTEKSGLLNQFFEQSEWLIDSMELGWHHWVRDFNQKQQRNLLQRLGINDSSGLQQGLLMISLGGAALLIGYLITQLRLRRPGNPTQQAWQKHLQQLQKMGLAIQPWQTPDQVLKSASEKWPQQKTQLAHIAALYTQIQYAEPQSDSSQRQQLIKLRSAIRRLRLKKLKRAGGEN